MKLTSHEYLTTEEIGKILLQRLHQLQNRPWMIVVLEKAIAQMTDTPIKVDDYKIHYSKMHPRTNVNVFLEANLKNPASGHRFCQQFSCIFLPSFKEQKTLPLLSSSHRRSLGNLGFTHFEAYLQDPVMFLRAFPLDPDLKGLVTATDNDVMKDLFSQFYRDVNGLTYDVLNYKPGYSCTLHYTLTRGSADEGNPASYQAYGKLYPDEDDHHSFLSLKTSWGIANTSGGLWTAARPLKRVPEWGFVLQEAVQGRLLRKLFSEKINHQISDLEKYLLDIVVALRSFQTSGAQIGPYRNFFHLYSEQEKNVMHLINCHPECGEEVARLRQEILKLEPEIPQSAIGFSHGDFAYWNILVDEVRGGKVGVIDFDRASQAEMAYDAAYFLNHLCSLAYRKSCSFKEFIRLYHCFRQNYLDSAPEVSSERLAIYEALELSSFVLRSFRKNRHPSKWLDWAKQLMQFAKGSLEKAAGNIKKPSGLQ